MAGRIIGLVVILLLAGDSAFADLLVQPILVRMTVQPGKRYTRELKLENSDPREAEILTLRLAELTQKADSSWTEFRADDPDFSKAVVRSCVSWLTLPPGEIKLGGYQIVPFSLQIEVPAATRGFFFAAIVATTTPKPVTLPNGTATTMNMEFVVPVILEVQSTPMRQDISLTDVGLSYQAQQGETPAGNNVVIDIANNGGTFSGLLPIVRLWEQSGGHWRRFSEVKFPEISIMPGAKLHVQQNVGQALPSGSYQLEAALYVDNRRGPIIKKTVQFAGDPTLAGSLRGQAALAVAPSNLFLEIVPGATRTTALQVTNGSEEDITVNAELIVPEQMHLAVNGRGVKGDDLACTGWATVNPSTFTLRGHARRNLTILAKMPKESTKYPSYYGTLRLHVSYADGKSAGVREALICAQNKQVDATPFLGATVLTISESGPSRYFASATFSNGGETHVTTLSCQGVLSIVGAGGGGAAVAKRFLMSSEQFGQRGAMLPFDVRSFSGVLDLSDVAPGPYYMTSILNYPGGPAEGLQRQIIIEVTEQGGRKYARMVGASDSAPQVIKL
ncbi:MAG: hypothetical protein NTZ17_15245 [Phycisphaerae bacterium]|nr:hypothetical protein [Phycisphaerae bacterium]